jgi:hypothetical protein
MVGGCLLQACGRCSSRGSRAAVAAAAAAAASMLACSGALLHALLTATASTCCASEGVWSPAEEVSAGGPGCPSSCSFSCPLLLTWQGSACSKICWSLELILGPLRKVQKVD